MTHSSCTVPEAERFVALQGLFKGLCNEKTLVPNRPLKQKSGWHHRDKVCLSGWCHPLGGASLIR